MAKVQPLTEAVYYILLSLQTPLHGYGIMQKVKDMTDGRVTLGAGTLYGAISTLTSKGYIVESSVNVAKKEYVITELGQETLKREYYRLMELVENGKGILEEHYE